MKTFVKIKKNTFNEIKEGTFFISGLNKKIYLKIKEGKDPFNYKCNAILVEDGDYCCFDSNAEIIPFRNAEFEY